MHYDIKADNGGEAHPVVTSEGAAFDGEALRDMLRAELKSELAGLGRRIASETRPPLAAGGVAASSFADQYLRKGLEQDFETKRFSTSVGAEGGLALPQELDQRIETVLTAVSPIRSIANVVKVGTASYRKLVALGGFASGWVGDAAARPETGTPTFAEIVPSMGEIYANPAASQTMLDDALFDVEGWLANEIAGEFGRAEGVAFVSGTGVSQPKGFLTYPVASTGDSVRAWGTVQYVASGTAGAFPAANPADKLVDLIHSLRAPYRQGAVFVMNSSTLAVIRKFKDSTGAFIWQPSLAHGSPATLLGYPVVEADAMPDIGASALAIAFGNFSAGYIVAERGETAVLRDPYSNKPFVHFYATRRVGGAIANSEAIKLMRFSAS